MGGRPEGRPPFRLRPPCAGGLPVRNQKARLLQQAIGEGKRDKIYAKKWKKRKEKKRKQEDWCHLAQLGNKGAQLCQVGSWKKRIGNDYIMKSTATPKATFSSISRHTGSDFADPRSGFGLAPARSASKQYVLNRE